MDNYQSKTQLKTNLNRSNKTIEELKLRLNAAIKITNEEKAKNEHLQKALNDKVVIIKELLDKKWWQFWK